MEYGQLDSLATLMYSPQGRNYKISFRNISDKDSIGTGVKGHKAPLINNQGGITSN